jgi:hypothetical protein
MASFSNVRNEQQTVEENEQAVRPGTDPGGIECSSRYGQIFPIMDSKIVLGKNSPLIYFHAIHFCLKIIQI